MIRPMLSLAIATLAIAAFGAQPKTFHGEISDTQCAMNVHSKNGTHDEMIRKHTMGTDAASCARACVKRGGDWVLKSGKVVYRLKDQAQAEPFSGQRVTVTGTLDKATNTIDNVAVEAEKKK